LADRTDTNVAMASTKVPTAVAIEAAVAQSMAHILARPPEPGRPGAILPFRRSISAVSR
jgi:hypothetical protein